MKKTYIPLEDLHQNVLKEEEKNQDRKLKFGVHIRNTKKKTQKLSSRSELFWLSYSVWTASETSQNNFPATQGCKPWQGSITSFTMYALSDVTLNYQYDLLAYMFIKKSLNTCV